MTSRQNADTIRGSFDEFFKAIKILRDAKLIQPCLALLYSTMDAAAWLDRPDEHQDVTKDDFVAWVTRYVLEGRSLRCRAIDLYAARCGMLHSFSAYSRLSRKGEAYHMAYSWGIARREDLETAVWLMKKDNLAAVHVDDLMTATEEGFETFLQEVSQDPSRLQKVLDRGGKLYSHLPTIAVQRYNEIKTGARDA